MPDYGGGRYEDQNGDGVNEYGSSPPHKANSHGDAVNDHSDSRSQRGSQDYEREPSRSKELEKGRDRERDRERDKDKYRDRDRDRDRDRERHHKDHHRDRSDRRERGISRDEDDDYYRSRDHERKEKYSFICMSMRREYDRDKDGRRKHRSRSREKSRSHRSSSRSHRSRSRSHRSRSHSHRSRSRSHRSRSRSRSRSKSKRISGFDMAPPTAMLAGAAAAAAGAGVVGAAAGQLPPALSGIYQSLYAPNAGQIFAAPTGTPVQAMTQQATRHARRVYVGGLSAMANEQNVAHFFNEVMSVIGGNTAAPGDAVVNVYINYEKKFAFVEMRSVEEASNAMALDGIIFQGAPVKVRRPTDYNPSLAAALGPSQPNPNLNLAAVGLTPGSAGGLEGPDRIFVGGLPYYFTELQIRELLESFGPLRGFDLVKDRETGNSKGYAFCVYQDLSVTDIACAALNGIKMGDKTLTVRRANQGASQPKPEQETVLYQVQQQVAMQRLLFQGGPAAVPTRVVCLTQVVTADELRNDDEYQDIVEDMREEGGKYGNLVKVAIPRPNPSGEPSPGVGKVFLEYADVDGASKARAGLNGRKFSGNQVVAVYYPENKFAQGDYDA